MAEKEEKELKFIWQLENYSYCWNQKDDFLLSPNFELDVFEGSSWCLKLYPRGVSSNENYVSVHLKRSESSDGPLGITVDYEIAILGPGGTAEYVKKSKNRCFRKGHAFGFDNLAFCEEILEAKRSVLLPEDILTVQCRIFPKGTELKHCTEIIAKTLIEIKRSIFIWKIGNYFAGERNASNRLKFFITNNEKRIVHLKIVHLDGYVALRFFYHCPTIKVIRCKIGILDANNLISEILIDKQINNSERIDVKLIAANEILKQKSLYLPNDKLTLHCDLTFSVGVQPGEIKMISLDNAFTLASDSGKASSEIDTPPKNYSCHCTDNYDSFKTDFQNLYHEGTLCDFTLKIGNENIKAHKVVLGARSPVFKAMLTSNMKESEKNMVDISDLDANTVRRMLTFMYTDTAGDLDWETATKLYFAADKYGVMKLKRVCSSVLERNFSVSNVGEALSLANLYGDDDLKNLALEFISNHDTEVICSTEWKTFMTEEVHLAAETMRYIFMKRAENSGGKT